MTAPAPRFRTSVVGLCLANGQHTVPRLLAECPVHRQAARRRAAQAAATKRWGAMEGPNRMESGKEPGGCDQAL